jgi:DNA-binding NtrC family response regulator
MDMFENEEVRKKLIKRAKGNYKCAKTLLVIDDEESALNVNVKILRQLGYVVYAASSGSAGVEIYKKKQDEIAAVLSDMVMPEMSGLDVHQELVKINPGVKFIIASGTYIHKDALKALGIKAYIFKPFKIDELGNTVRGVLDS